MTFDLLCRRMSDPVWPLQHRQSSPTPSSHSQQTRHDPATATGTMGPWSRHVHHRQPPQPTPPSPANTTHPDKLSAASIPGDVCGTKSVRAWTNTVEGTARTSAPTSAMVAPLSAMVAPTSAMVASTSPKIAATSPFDPAVEPTRLNISVHVPVDTACPGAASTQTLALPDRPRGSWTPPTGREGDDGGSLVPSPDTNTATIPASSSVAFSTRPSGTLPGQSPTWPSRNPANVPCDAKTSGCTPAAPTPPQTFLDKPRAASSYAHSSGGRRWMALLLFLLHLLAHTTPTLAQVVGVAMECEQEGQPIKVPKEVERDNPCISCSCQNKIVVCERKKCPSLEGCYWKMMQDPRQCCQECKGCEHEGRWYRHGSRWSDGCRHYQCQSGVLTTSDTQCHLPCNTPLARRDDTCCRSCPGCWLEGRRVMEGEVVTSRVDPCVRCMCSKGTLSCKKEACPVLSCSKTKQVPTPDSCCMTCLGSRELITPPEGRCFLNGYLYMTGTNRTLDPCTTCICHQGYITCKRATCPILNCSQEHQILRENECCPTCSAAAYFENVCHMHGMIHKDGEEWQKDQCTSCNCINGSVSCHTLPCEYFNKPCPPGYRRIESEHECCPRCEKAPGVCVVFGDPHYHTFDGLLFNFQGACKYILAKTCKGKGGFSLKVSNDARRSNNFSWTKSLTFRVPGAKVKLYQRLRTKINNRIEKPPYEEHGVLNLTREGQAISITTAIGVRLLWDGASYVEVEVPVEMQGHTCGLCGNFNGDVADDLITKNGALVKTPNQMAMSWSTGKVRQCSRRMKNEVRAVGLSRPQRLTCPVSRDQSERQCGLLNSTAFQACHAIVPIDKFYKSCILDMCECRSTRRCECDTLQAYARQCQRLGIHVPEWRKESKCGGLECPHGAEYMECAPPCRATCRNPTPNPKCHTRSCRAGCYCPPPTVLHRGACIPVEDCRKSKKRRRNRRRNR